MGFWSSLFSKLTGNTPAAPTPWVRPETSDGHGSIAVLESALESRAKGASNDLEPLEGPQWWEPAGVTRTEPMPVELPNMTTAVKALENTLVSHFDGHDLTMPPLLNGAERVLVKLRDRNSNLSDIAAIVAEDPVIAAVVLRTANSAFYRGLQKITSLPAALQRMGVNAIRMLMLRESMRAAMFDRDGVPPTFADAVWKRSLAAATVMQGLSDFTNVPRDDAFLYGLLHNIGDVVILRIVQDQLVATGDELDVPSFEYLCAVCHQEFGELIADAWKLPPDVKALIVGHHAFPEVEDPLQVPRLQLLLTRMIVSLLGYASGQPFRLLDSRVANALELPQRAEFMAYLRRLPRSIERALKE